MVDSQKIGIVLMIIAVLLLFSFTTYGDDFIPDLPGLPEKNGFEYDCQMTLDHNSIKSPSCEKIDECRTISLDFLGLFDQERTLEFWAGGSKIRQQSFSLSVLGFDKPVGFNVCVDKDITQGVFVLRNDENAQLASAGVTL